MSVQPGTPTTNKKWRIDVDLDGGSTLGTGNWAQVRGLNSISPAVNNTVQDSTDYDSPIWGSDTVTGRKWQLQGTAFRKEYAAAYDEGQEFLRAAADSIEIVHVRWYERESFGEAYEGFGIVQWEPQGGDPTALSSASFTILGQGERTAITNPHDATAVAVINSVSPASGPAAGGTNVIITGSGFSGLSGATAVKFGGTNATEYTVVNSGTIVAKTPAHAAGVVDVLVTNPNGPSTTGTGKYTYV